MSILELLNNERIFNIFLLDGNKEVKIWERCEDHFFTTLNKQEMNKLIEELKQLADKMI